MIWLVTGSLLEQTIGPAVLMREICGTELVGGPFVGNLTKFGLFSVKSSIDRDYGTAVLFVHEVAGVHRVPDILQIDR